MRHVYSRDVRMSPTGVDFRPVRSDSRLASPADSATPDQKGVDKGDGMVGDCK